MERSSIALIGCEDWLRQRLSTTRGVLAAYIFGSSLTIETPSDVDLCIVTDARVGSDEWHEVRTSRDSIVDEFQRAFGLPLSVMLVTPSEWLEVDGVIIRDRRLLKA